MTTTMTDLANGKTFVFNEALPGRDAYEEALALGFEGTRAEWIASLRGLDFNPDQPTWENDRTYPPRAAVIHSNSFWFARVTDLGTEPGTNSAVWMKLVHGEDAATLADAIATLTAIRDDADAIANAPEDEDLGEGRFSANHHRLKAAADRSISEQASIDAAANAAALPAIAAALSALHSALGQASREIDRIETEGEEARESYKIAAEGTAATLSLLLNITAVLGQLAGQVNGGRARLAAGSLADPALFIGEVGIYSAAENTLSVAISGVERLRVTADGITVYGTISQA